MKNLEPQHDLKKINEQEKTIKNQQVIIHRQDKQINELNHKIKLLETPAHVPVVDLLGIDE